MGWHFIGFDIDGSIDSQEIVRERLDRIVDLRSQERDLRLWASSNAIRKLKRTLRDLRVQRNALGHDRWLSFIGSGDYHHITSLLLESLPDHLRPVNLVLIDNHPDWTNLPPAYHCGNWVSTTLKLPWIDSVVMVGQDSEDLNAGNLLFAPFEYLNLARLRLYPYEREHLFTALRWPRQVRAAVDIEHARGGTKMFFNTIRKSGIEKIASEIACRLAGQNVYLSIDKDALSTDYALTDWDQGRLTLSEITYLLQKLAASCNLIGADVCGETAPRPLTGPLKRFDSGRLWNEQRHDFTAANALNQNTNMRLFDAFKRAIAVGASASAATGQGHLQAVN
jgi:arginase family enzyme